MMYLFNQSSLVVVYSLVPSFYGVALGAFSVLSSTKRESTDCNLVLSAPSTPYLKSISFDTLQSFSMIYLKYEILLSSIDR